MVSWVVRNRKENDIKKHCKSLIYSALDGMWGSHGEQGEQIAARETSKNLGLRALTSTDFLYSGSSAKILADSTGV